MSKQNLLAIVKDILSDMSSDEVNSIEDTDEALQVAQIVRSTYQAMISNRNWSHTQRLVSLTAYADSSKPTHITLDENIKELISIFYDKSTVDDTRIRYEEVLWKDPDDFLRYINKRDSGSSSVDTVIDSSGIKLLILNNKAPTYYTSFDDNTIVFDSYDEAVDSTIQSSKIQARGFIIPPFTLEDEFIPDLPLEAFPALVEESKSKAQSRLNEVQDIKAEQDSVRQSRWLSRKEWRVHGGIKYPNYGRGRARNPDPTFKKDR